MDRAGLAARLAAAFFEVIFLTLLLLTGGVIMYAIFLGWQRLDPDEAAPPGLHRAQLLFMILWNLMVLLVSALEVFIAKGFGKTVVGLKIMAADGAPASRGALAARWAMKYAPLIVLLVVAMPLGVVHERMAAPGWLDVLLIALCLAVLVSFLFALGPLGQALHDRLTGTAVFRRLAPFPEQRVHSEPGA